VQLFGTYPPITIAHHICGVFANVKQAIINVYDTAKQACFAVKKSNSCSFCKCVSQNAFVQGTLCTCAKYKKQSKRGGLPA